MFMRPTLPFRILAASLLVGILVSGHCTVGAEQTVVNVTAAGVTSDAGIVDVASTTTTAPTNTTPEPRPSWLDGQMPATPNTRFVAVQTATFADRNRAAEALEVEIEHAWTEFVNHLAVEHRIPPSFSEGLRTTSLTKAVIERYIEAIEGGAEPMFRGRALLPLSPELSSQFTSELTQFVVRRRLQLGFTALGMILACLGSAYMALRLLGGQPELIARRISKEI